MFMRGRYVLAAVAAAAAALAASAQALDPTTQFYVPQPNPASIVARDYYPGARQFIVMLRDPFDRFVSTWRYLQFQIRSGVHGSPPTVRRSGPSACTAACLRRIAATDGVR